MDDLVIVGRTEEEALSRLEQTMDVLKNNGIRLKREKCKFMQKEVKYLGYKIFEEGMKPDEEKI